MICEEARARSGAGLRSSCIRTIIRVSLAAVLPLLLWTGAACHRHQPAAADAARARSVSRTPPNIILITLCTVRYDHMGAAGYPRPTTPFLDSLAGRGVFFEEASSASSWTRPSVASILTGLTPNVHGLTDVSRGRDIRSRAITPKRVLADGIQTLAECLGDAGYATADRINNVHGGEFFHLTHGLDDEVTDHTIDAPRMLDDFARWLGTTDARRPFFFFMLPRGAHIPYDPDHSYYR